MNFLKNLLGYEKGLKERIKNFKARGSLFEITKDVRNIKLKDCTITFFTEANNTYSLDFRTQKQEIFQLPIHVNMNVVTFKINKGGKQLAVFEWQLEHQTQHVGCNMDFELKHQFKDILCLILKQISKDQHIKSHEVFCQELAGIPTYKTQIKTNVNVSSSISSENKEQINDILIKEAQKNDNKMVHTCSYYEVQLRQKKLLQENVIFVLKTYPDFKYQFQLVNATGFAFIKKQIDTSLNYEINVEKGYIRWFDIENGCKIIEANFQGKRDAALSLKYNMFEVMYQLREKKKVQQDVSPQQIAYLKKISDEQPQEEVTKAKIIQLYQDQKQIIEEIGEKSFIYEDQDLKFGINYNNICQAKIGDFSIASLGSLMENLHIDEESHIKPNNKKKLTDKDGYQVEIGQILLHDSDSKAFIRGKNGRLYYQDIVKSKVVQQFNPSPSKGIIHICPEYKLADSKAFKTFKAISEQAIYEIDPRTNEGVGSLKQYSTNPMFTTLSATGNGNFVTGAKNGQIRFFKQIGKNANNKFTSAGDPVIHLDTTKDGKWVLSTFRRYLRLIPTENDDDVSLFDKKIPLSERPTPIKLEITLDDLQKYGVKDFCFLPAKFDENKQNAERFIISGFENCTVIWNLSRIMKGDRSYLISKSEGKVVQADFRFNDPTKIIMATSKGIVMKDNKIKQ